MYHYVRDTARTPFPGIKALSVSEFRGQLAHMQREYTLVRVRDVLGALRGENTEFPDNAAVLTFDDGYADHYETVYPILSDLGIEGIFFPPAKPVLERKVLDVNRIQFAIAACDDPARMVGFVKDAVTEFQEEYDLDTSDAYWAEHGKPRAYDGPEIGFVKHMLQHALPEALRAILCERLFRAFVSEDEAAFAEELYMRPAQIREMAAGGQIFGSHGYGHYWMNTLAPEEQRRDIAASLDFLVGLGLPAEDWTMCYPYGGYDKSLVTTVRSMGCSLGFTTERAVADLDVHDPLCLPRLDTNEIPKSLEA